MKLMIAVASACFVAAAPAMAQIGGPCMKRAAFLRELEENYGESPVALGIAADGKVIEVIASGRTGTWTIIMTLPNGIACGIAAGTGWQAAPPRSSSDLPT